jgi:hypothetical protein
MSAKAKERAMLSFQGRVSPPLLARADLAWWRRRWVIARWSGAEGRFVDRRWFWTNRAALRAVAQEEGRA